jgi:hypothetical protein
MKLIHYTAGGRVASELFEEQGWEPLSTEFFALTPTRVRKYQDDCSLASRTSNASDDQATCSAHILAARVMAGGGLGKKEINRKATIGFCCQHGIPLRSAAYWIGSHILQLLWEA